MMAVCMMFSFSNAQTTNKALEKALKKEYKAKKKEYKKEGWKLFGSSRSLDVALLSHYERLRSLGEDGYEVVGVATRFKSKNVGKQMAANNACVTYAQNSGSHIKGRILSDMQGDAIVTSNEFEKFYAAYERLVEKEIKGEMQESYAIIRDNEDGTFEMQVFYIVSESAASKARMRALENAARETEVAQEYAKRISDFVKEGFKE